MSLSFINREIKEREKTKRGVSYEFVRASEARNSNGRLNLDFNDSFTFSGDVVETSDDDLLFAKDILFFFCCCFF